MDFNMHIKYLYKQRFIFEAEHYSQFIFGRNALPNSFKVITLYLRALSLFFHSTSGKINPIYSTHNTQLYKVNTLPKQFVKEPILKHNLFMFFFYPSPSITVLVPLLHRTAPFIYTFPSFHRDPTEFQSSNRGLLAICSLDINPTFYWPFWWRHPPYVCVCVCTCEGPETIQLSYMVFGTRDWAILSRLCGYCYRSPTPQIRPLFRLL